MIITLKNGQDLRASGGILGISDLLEVTDGWDGNPSICYRDGSSFGPDEFSPEDKKEIAEMMVDRWKRWGGL